MTTLHKAAQQALLALERQHKDRTAYSRAKQSANATCGEFKENTLSALIESGYMQVMGNQTVEAITALRTALAQEQAEPIAWLQPKTVDGYSRPDLGYEACSSADYGAFPVYCAPPKAEQAQEPVAVVGTQVDVWRGCDGRWAPPGGPIKTALMLKDMPVGTMLYTTPPQRQPLTEEEIWALYFSLLSDDLDRSERVAFARAIERAHGIVTCGDTKERA